MTATYKTNIKTTAPQVNNASKSSMEHMTRNKMSNHSSAPEFKQTNTDNSLSFTLSPN